MNYYDTKTKEDRIKGTNYHWCDTCQDNRFHSKGKCDICNAHQSHTIMYTFLIIWGIFIASIIALEIYGPNEFIEIVSELFA